MYENIYIVRHNNGERNFRNERTILDSYALDDFFSENVQVAMSDEGKVIRKLFVDRLKIIAPYALVYLDDNEYCDITSIQYETANPQKKLDELRIQLIEQSKSVSGDDDSYDYFPDLIFAFNQVCDKLDRLDFYKSVASELNKLLDYEEDYELFIS